MNIINEIERNLSQNSKFSDRERLIFAELKSIGLPDAKNEEWKYISFNSVFNHSFNLEAIQNGSQVSEVSLIPQLDCFKFVFINGVFMSSLSSKLSGNEGFSISEKASLLENSYKNYNHDGFILLNEIFNATTFLLEVHKNKTVSKPVAFYFIHSLKNENAISFPNISIKVGENASAKFVETYGNINTSISISNTILSFEIQENALVEYYKVFNGSENDNHIGTTQINQVGKSEFHGTTVNLSGGSIRNNLNISIQKPYSNSKIYGLNLLSGSTTVDNHTVVDHQVPNCESTELYKSALDDDATAIFNGKIFVRQDAQKTNAYQSSKNILLSNTATANSKPQLEIWADDVKCSHGHATGQLDKDALFYLKARGIGDKEAKSMLTQAFVQDVLNTIQIDALKEYCEKEVNKRFA